VVEYLASKCEVLSSNYSATKKKKKKKNSHKSGIQRIDYLCTNRNKHFEDIFPGTRNRLGVRTE
jgi:hypothetical protein